jgi:hypothetical protein
VPTTTINREQRDGLYELVRNHLGSVSDFFDALEREKDFGKAEELGLELAEDILLMQDLGWGEEDGRDGVELTMRPFDLMELLDRLRGEASLVLAAGEESAEDAETNKRFRQGHEACEWLLEDLDPRRGKSS